MDLNWVFFDSAKVEQIVPGKAGNIGLWPNGSI